MSDALARLSEAGVSIWLYDLSRWRLVEGSLARLVSNRHVVGVTTNPTTFTHAIEGRDCYDVLAADAGLQVGNGVVVDAALGMSHPDIYVAGDVANALHPLLGKHIRVEHWANALHQAEVAARSMLGERAFYNRVPYFFTDQYDRNERQHLGRQRHHPAPRPLRCHGRACCARRPRRATRPFTSCNGQQGSGARTAGVRLDRETGDLGPVPEDGRGRGSLTLRKREEGWQCERTSSGTRA